MDGHGEVSWLDIQPRSLPRVNGYAGSELCATGNSSFEWTTGLQLGWCELCHCLKALILQQIIRNCHGLILIGINESDPVRRALVAHGHGLVMLHKHRQPSNDINNWYSPH